jgi:2-polyprenyl-6-methoxyphenol hydroxylase-like FAD-dependent oxidoreductase
LLIGADGVHSVVRRTVVGDYTNSFCGYHCWRGITRNDNSAVKDNESIFVIGNGSQFGMFPLTRGRVYWFATKNSHLPRNALGTDSKSDLLEIFAKWPSFVGKSISSTPSSAIVANDIYDRDPNPKWGERCVTLLGDAAHVSTPNLGQGACMALEDAVVLAHCLQKFGLGENALRQYESMRYRRTKAIVLESRLMGWSFQLEDGFFSKIRGWAMRTSPRFLWQRNLERHLDFKVPD